MRSGKTLSSIAAREMLREIGFHGRTLVLSPENVINEVWGHHFTHVNPDLNVYVSDKTVAHCQQHGMRDDTDVLVLNHGKLPYTVIDLDKWGFDFLIVDEGSVFRTWDKEPLNNLSFLLTNSDDEFYPSQTRSKRWFWNLTATPHPRGGTDIYGMCKLINPELMQLSFNQWRAMVSDPVKIYQGTGPKRRYLYTDWQQKDEDYVAELCAERMHPSIRFRTEDCVDLPPQSYSYFHCPPSGDQQTIYNMIGRHKAAKLGEDKFRAKNTPNKTNKLLQAAGGVIKNTAGAWVEVGAKKRMDTLLRLFEEADGKMVVFCTFKSQSYFIQEQLRKKRIKCEVINGSTPKKKREEYRSKFQKDRRKSVLILHPAITMFGTTVSKASVTVWWVPPMHGEYWTQGNERARAPGSTKTLIAMFYSGTTEREYYERARAKKRINEKVVDWDAEFRKTRKHDESFAEEYLQDWDDDEG